MEATFKEEFFKEEDDSSEVMAEPTLLEDDVQDFLDNEDDHDRIQFTHLFFSIQ